MKNFGMDGRKQYTASRRSSKVCSWVSGRARHSCARRLLPHDRPAEDCALYRQIT